MIREHERSGAPRRGRAVDAGSVLMAVGELVRREVDLDSLLVQVIDAVTTAMSADRGTIFLIDRTRGDLFSKAGYYPEVGEIRLALGQGIAGHVARSGETIILARADDDARFHRAIDRATGYATQSVLCVPVDDHSGQTFAVIQLLNKHDADFDQEDAALLRALAGQVAAVIESTSLYRQLQAATGALAYRYNGIVGQSPAMLEVYELVAKAATTDATVLLGGETGTGKGAIARAIHYNGPRRRQPLVSVDCASLPATLIENELFGHERGAFTGADQRSIGKFEAADGGTVFLDEVGELPLALQGKLLRVLQERAFERVGGRRRVEVDVRIIAATHADLRDLVDRRLFREDLYYRLRVVTIDLPPLRQRGPVDLEALANHFLDRYSRRHRRPFRPLTQAALARLRAHTWPGNIRELENCIESAVVLADSDRIDAGDLPMTGARTLSSSATSTSSSTSTHAPTSTSPSTSTNPSTSTDAPTSTDAQPGRPGERPELKTLSWTEMERLYIGEVLRAHDGNRSRAAAAMGIGRSTLLRKIRSLAIDIPPQS